MVECYRDVLPAVAQTPGASLLVPAARQVFAGDLDATSIGHVQRRPHNDHLSKQPHAVQKHERPAQALDNENAHRGRSALLPAHQAKI